MSKSKEWRARLSRQRNQESVASFCRREGVSSASYYAWRRRLQHGFVEIVIPKSSTLTLKIGEIHIEVPQSFDPEHLRAVLDVLR